MQETQRATNLELRRENRSFFGAPGSAWFWLALVTALIPVAWYTLGHMKVDRFLVPMVGVLVCVAFTAGAVFLTVRAGHSFIRLFQLVANLSPTILLMSVFPFISGTLSAGNIGDSRELMVVLAVSVTVPWIASAVSTPIYTPLSTVTRKDTTVFYRKFCQLWPSLLLWSFPGIVFFALVMLSIKGWGIPETSYFMLGLFTNVLFSQAIIPAQETQRFGYVLTAWACYAGFMLFFPQWWFFAPLAGLFPQLWLMRNGLSGFLEPEALPIAQIARQMFRGAMYGSVLWADKFVLVLLFVDQINIFVVYAALIPVVVAQSVYFASQFDVLSTEMEGLRSLIDSIPCHELTTNTTSMSSRIGNSVANTTLVASGLGLGLMLIASAWNESRGADVLVLILAPIIFLLLMLLTFELAQLQQDGIAEWLTTAHLVTTVLSLWLLSIPIAYLIIIAIDLIVATLALLRCQNSLKNAPYELFWKEAAGW